MEVRLLSLGFAGEREVAGMVKSEVKAVMGTERRILYGEEQVASRHLRLGWMSMLMYRPEQTCGRVRQVVLRARITRAKAAA